MSARFAARIFGALTALVAVFQLALALGAPWGAVAMGGAFPGVYPPAMRLAALFQILILGVVALVVFVRAGLVFPRWRVAARWPAWVVVVLLAVGVVLNLITPSGLERLIWAPVAALLFLASLRVALET
ncbi:hypothetical protein [Phenylobacterium sp.]|uniref:hypothetical protein n=1 Tax=Phenylobacterium sp. TaxID=1871053 RepID=UPI00286BEAB3|nr:hypothetical protein [Phenylobacterium sp.]